MRGVKLLLYSGITFFMLVTLLGWLIPAEVRISRTVNISANVDSIKSKVFNPDLWYLWNPALEGQVGIVDIDYNDRIKFNNTEVRILQTDSIKQVTAWWVNGKPTGNAEISVIPAESQVIVNWTFILHAGWQPWERFRLMIADKQLGPTMELGLQQLKLLVEGN